MSDSFVMLPLLFIFSYIIGSLNVSKILTVWLGFGGKGDISDLGSKNAGANNMWRVFGVKIGLTVMLLDIGRGLLIAGVASVLFGLSDALVIFCGVCGMLGHNWPIFFRFRGGKGLAIIGGVLLFFSPLGAMAAWLVAILFIGVFDRMFRAQVSGLAPFVAAPVYIISNLALGHWTLEHIDEILVWALVSVLLVTVARRLHAGWGDFSNAPSKVRSFVYLIVYDRATGDPPPLDFAAKKRVAR